MFTPTYILGPDRGMEGPGRGPGGPGLGGPGFMERGIRMCNNWSTIRLNVHECKTTYSQRCNLRDFVTSCQ